MEPTNLLAALEQQHAPLIEAVKALVRIPSVITEPAEDAPFGKPIEAALRQALEIAEGLGFRTVIGNGGAYGYAEIGSGLRMAAVLGHVDVVPAGSLNEWRTDPFDPVIADGRLYGRGVQDDKGPMLAALFGAKALMDAGVRFEKRLRFIFGTDEENLWRCMKSYLAQEELPALGFTPDARFPLIYAEKGLLQAVLEGPNDSGVQVGGGTAFNAVADAAEYRGPKVERVSSALTKLGYAHSTAADRVIVSGKAAHAQVTEEGVNAICGLALGLHAAGIHSRCIDFLADLVGEDPFGLRIFGDVQDVDTGRLKFNVGMIETGDTERLSVDLRLPASADHTRIVRQLQRAAQAYGLNYRQHDWLAPIHIPRDSFLVRTLLKVYREVTGDRTPPETSGGATYARAIPNCVAYGAVFPGREKVEHQPNENILLEDLFKAMEIYARAIYALTRRSG